MLQAESDQHTEQQQGKDGQEDGADVSEAVSHVMATMHGIQPSNGMPAKLGPTPTGDVFLDGTNIEALLDTGSPVSIVSLDFFLQVSAKNRPPSQSPEDWGKAVMERLQPTSVSLRSYGGEELSIVRQVRCLISCGEYSVESVLQVQKGAPVNLLLGTDLLPQLGFSLIQKKGSCVVDVLDVTAHKQTENINNLESHTPQPGPESHATASQCSESDHRFRSTTKSSENSKTPSAIVKLIQATRLPPRHSKLVRAGIERAEIETRVCLFEPTISSLSCKGLSIADAVVERCDDGEMVLVVTNQGAEAAHLEVGEVLGELQPVLLLDNFTEPTNNMIRENEEEENSPEAPKELVGRNTSMVSTVVAEESKMEERMQQLIMALGLEQLAVKEAESEELKQMVKEFSRLFALDSSELGRTTATSHTINTRDHHPIKQPPRRIPFSLRGKVCELVQDMLKQGVIVPSASPIVLVTKKDGSTRFCVDYRKLNSITKLDVYPLPRIDDSLDLLADTKFFSSLDLVSGYWQVSMSEDSQEKTAFTTHIGLYEFRVMPFGLCNAPTTFQRLMEGVFTGLVGEKCIIYLDDVLVIGRTYKEHLDNLREVFTRLTNAGLKLKPSKCKLVQREVEFLGYVVSCEGISTDPKKLAAVAEFPRPSDLRALRGFLGLTSYYRCFVPSFYTVAQPLYKLEKRMYLLCGQTSAKEHFRD